MVILVIPDFRAAGAGCLDACDHAERLLPASEKVVKMRPETARNQTGARSPRSGIRIVDTTCRDGEQMPGISFTAEEKLAMAKAIEAIGVEQLETFATYNDSDRSCARRLRAQSSGMSVMGWSRMVKEDIEDSIANDVDAVSISTDTSDLALTRKLHMTREEQLAQLVGCVEFAKSHGVYVCFNAGDATRTSTGYLIEFAAAGKSAGGDRLRICDTLGVLTPAGSSRLVSDVMGAVDIDIEFHAHNDFGLAVANALGAVDAASAHEDRTLWISTTVNGLGERAGNVPLEVLLMNLKTHYGVSKYRTDSLRSLCSTVAAASRVNIPPNYPIVGSNMFTHKSGIHVDGVLKEPSLYEAFDPATVGAARRIAIGKHSGRSSIKHKLRELGLVADSAMVDQLRAEVGRLGEGKKGDVTDSEFMSLYSRLNGLRENGGAHDSKRLLAVDIGILSER
jgi:isopropylmalate/homocitrate/citramalate synthase